MRHLKALTLGILALLAGAAGAQQPAAAPQNVRGDVVALTGNDLIVKSRGAETRVKLADNASVGVVAKADPTGIGNGAYLGAAAVPQPDGTLRAIEVHVLPEAWRGKGEGHRPWDLQPGSTMTSATVGESKPPGAPSTMTNATVANVTPAEGGRKLLLEYKGGEKTVVVPPDTPVVTVESGDRSRLVPGAHVVAVGSRQPDGTLLAQRVYVGKNGVVPPM